MTDKTMTLEQAAEYGWKHASWDLENVLIGVRERHLSQPAERGEAAWKAIVEQCMVTEAVTPEESDPYGTISQLIDYHVANTATPPAAGVPDEWRGALEDAINYIKSPPVGHDDAMLCLALIERADELLSATPSPTIDVAAVREVGKWLREGGWETGIAQANKLARAIGDSK